MVMVVVVRMVQNFMRETLGRHPIKTSESVTPRSVMIMLVIAVPIITIAKTKTRTITVAPSPRPAS